MDASIETGLDVLSWMCLVVGGFFSIAGGIGLLRLPDFFSRMHAGGITDTMGAGLILLGLMFQAGISLALGKLLMILIGLWLTSPTSCHALAQAAFAQGLRPQLSGDPAGQEATDQAGRPQA
jgi:multicomponent Na+:H+ antiporter subunit G